MKALQNIQTVYFVGIGGIGMSALARYMKLQGKDVFGYDKTATELTDALQREGIQITFEDRVSELPAAIENTSDTLVVYTPAIPTSNNILTYFQQAGVAMMKRAALLGKVTQHTLCLAVAGTHGKTTTSAILGHLLAACDMPVTAFLGGIAENYDSNFIHKGSEITVVEADEFDRSFLQLHPNIACVTSMDADHLDIYGESAEIESAFHEFSNLVSDKKQLLHPVEVPLGGHTVAIDASADYEARNVRIEDGVYVFDLKTPQTHFRDLRFSLPGHHNLQNAITALGMALLAGSPTQQLPKALASFQGVQRRFSYRIKREDLVVIDDYAHHPTELNALFQAVAEMFPEDQKLIVFQPHLFSRTRDFEAEFAQSLSQFDEVLLLPIYPAREAPIAGVSSERLLALISSEKKGLITKQAMADQMSYSSCRVQLIVGAGDIGAEVKNVIKKRIA
ncbi:UDP-N-acetylmuramate--L-alanine ligase [Altibacter sp. HG106]|uniref:UDP-N-acetylmuramate--L-alanine ligase n=1 Tax=Altibacter sp. HG106 TaxID=3023937 RepID=UPI002350EFE7|nr:UDP-N-acetylmuramate--L-alanine ligase [Altibacter sp. HG106]MDC7994428.1 UDP-N-acetylmuramate--L-alanine ligase [Altibacter sp. HG106]